MSKTLLNLLLITLSLAFYFVVISPIYFGGGNLYTVPTGQSIISLREFNKEDDKALNQLEEGLAKITSLKNSYSSIPQDTQDRLNIMIPDSIDGVRLVSEVNSMVVANGLTAENISYTKEGEDKKLPGVGIYSVSFSTKCSYANLKLLLDKFENSMRLFSVQSVSFSSGLNLNEPMAVNIKMNTYYIK